MSAAEGVTVAPPELAAGEIRLPIVLPAELAGRRRLRLAYQVNDAGSAAPQWRDVVLALGEVVLASGKAAGVRVVQERGTMEYAKRRMRNVETFRATPDARAHRSLTPPGGGPRLEAWTSRRSRSSCRRSRSPSPSPPRPGCGPGCRCSSPRGWPGSGSSTSGRRSSSSPRTRRSCCSRVATAIELVGDKIPAVDHALDVIGTPLRPAAGALLAASVLGTVDRPAHLGRARHRGRRAVGPRAARRQVGAARGLDRGDRRPRQPAAELRRGRDLDRVSSSSRCWCPSWSWPSWA